MNSLNKDFNIESKQYNIIDLLWILFGYRRFLFIVVFISIIFGFGIAFLVPRQYKSITRVLPPKQTNTLSGMSGISSLMRSLPSGLSKLQKSDDLYDYIAVLRSRTVSEEIMNKFNLLQVYNITNHSMESGIKELVANTEIDWTEENTLEIRVWDRDAQRAADIANEYVELLNKRSLEIQTQEAKNNRLFIEQRLVQNKKDLFEAEQIFKDYQKKTGMVVIYDPTSSGTASLAEIYAQKARKEIEIGILKHTTKPGSSVYSQAEIELNSINGEINKFPDIGVESLRLYRNVAIQQKILEYMTPMFEEAKVNEHKDVPVAYVLDKAISGEKPDRPKRSYLIGISAFLGLIIGFLIIIWKEYVSHLRERFPEQYARLNQMKHLFSKRM